MDLNFSSHPLNFLKVLLSLAINLKVFHLKEPSRDFNSFLVLTSKDLGLGFLIYARKVSYHQTKKDHFSLHQAI